MPQYTSKARDDATRLEAQADAWPITARRNVQRSTDDVLGVVLFAAALFFAGISTKLASGRLGVAMLTFGIVVFVSTPVWIAVSPINVSV